MKDAKADQTTRRALADFRTTQPRQAAAWFSRRSAVGSLGFVRQSGFELGRGHNETNSRVPGPAVGLFSSSTFIVNGQPSPKLSLLFHGPALIDRLGQSMPGLVYVFDLIEQRNLYANRSLSALLGYSQEEMQAMGSNLLATIVHPEDLPLALAHHAQVAEVADDASLEFEYRVRAASGEWRWLHSWESVLTRDEAGRPQQLLGLAQDVTARLKTESELRESQRALSASEQRWRSIAENPFDFVVVIDRSYKYTFVNFVAPGLVREDLIGKATPLDFIGPADHDRVRAAFESVFKEGRPTSYEVYIPQLDKSFSSLVGPIREGDGSDVTHVSILTRDTSDERRARAQALQAEQQVRLMEAKLEQSARLEALGKLAGGIAHDFNNLLTGVACVAEVLTSRFEPGDPCAVDVADLRDAVARGAGLTRQLLTFSRQQPVTLTTVDLNLLLDETGRLLRQLIGADIELRLAIASEPFLVRGDRSQLEQVLMNLAVNARDAMPNGGSLAFELSTTFVDEAGTCEQPETPPGEFVTLSVTDTGCGMDSSLAARIFEPFFTTKPIGSGTGLGLSMVYGIVRQSGGFIQVHSEPERGTRFRIYLPRAATTESHSPDAVKPALRGNATVLLVEDEDLVLRLTRRLLEALGYRVHVATRSDAALEMIESGTAFDLLLTDVLLPIFDGYELYRKAAALRPALPVVFMSGYTDRFLGEERLREVGAQFLQKPFTLEALAEKVHAALKCRPT